MLNRKITPHHILCALCWHPQGQPITRQPIPPLPFPSRLASQVHGQWTLQYHHTPQSFVLYHITNGRNRIKEWLKETDSSILWQHTPDVVGYCYVHKTQSYKKVLISSFSWRGRYADYRTAFKFLRLAASVTVERAEYTREKMTSWLFLLHDRLRAETEIVGKS